MGKPKWLIDQELEKEIESRRPKLRLCCECAHYGRPVGWTKYKGKEITDLHECDIHPNCFNTRYSICCRDYIADTTSA